MRHILKITTAAALSTILFAGSDLQAQVWNAIPGTLNNVPQGTGPVRPFWDNFSDDFKPGPGGATRKCGAGFILTGVTAAGECNPTSLRPAGWLPFTGAPVTTYFSNNGINAQRFLFSAGLYKISQLGSLGLGGDVAGNDRPWGYFVGNTNTQLPQTNNFSTTINFTSSWGFYINLDRPLGTGIVKSTDAAYARHFAVFGYNAPRTLTQGGVSTISPGANQTYWIGLEDNACATLPAQGCTRKADYDNNDVLFSVTALPEPSTYLLMATGLVGFGFMARRRRSV